MSVHRPHKVPTVLQMEAAECGAACLAMVLAGFGRWETLDQVRDSCGVSRDGTSAADILAAARERGLDAKAYKREPETLAELPFPQILFWNFDHFVVLEAVRGHQFQINDPANGRRLLNRAEFGASFTGITLVLAPGPDFRRTRPPRPTLVRLLGQLKGSWPAFFAIILTSALLVAVGALVPGFTQVFVDDYLVQGHGDWLLPLLAAIIAVGLFNAALSFVYLRGLLLLRTKINAVVSARYVWRMFHLPFEFFVRRSPVEVSSRTQFATQVAGTVSGPVAQAAVSGIAMLGYAGVMLLYDPLLTAVVVALALVELAVLREVTRRVETEALHLQMIAGQAHAAGVQGAALLEQARATGSEQILFNRMVQAEARLINSEQRSGRTTHLLTALPYFGSRFTTLAVLGVGTLLIIHTPMTIGTLIGFLALSALFSTALGALTGVGTAVGQSGAALARLGDALDQQDAETASEPAGSNAAATGRIALRQVGFSHPKGAPVLAGISLEVEAGAAIAVLGGSAAGKSTLARLLVGIVSPTEGEIRFEAQHADGTVWLADCTGIAFVDQSAFFPKGSLRSAITFWNEAAPEADIARALADAEIADVVGARPGGIDGLIGEGGSGFSGGERQRLAIARALVDRPRILVLDDATSHLDEATEARVIENLRRRGITLILLTSRASAARRFDAVFGLEDGRLRPIDPEAAADPGALPPSLGPAPSMGPA
jgi:ABC-type bacteriocin/lantibiotic exporter with double-glycine peptidase domain